MAKLDYEEVMERVNWLESNTALKAIHDRARDAWRPLFKGTYKQDKPTHMTRGLDVEAPSPRLTDLHDGLTADMASFRAINTVSAHGENGPPSGELKKAADKVERFLSVLRSIWNNDGKLRREALSAQLIDECFVAIMQVDPSEPVPWSVIYPDPTSCFWPLRGVPDRPEMMARRYTQTVRKTEDTYTKAAGKSADRQGKRLKMRNKKFAWEPVGDDVATDGMSATNTGGDAKFGEEHEMIWFADREYVYHIAKDAEGDKGEIVWCGPNLTGGCPALIISGSPSALRDERMRPALWPVIQCVLQINLIRSIRSISALNPKPDMLIESTPEALAVAQSTGLVQQVQMQEGMPNLLTVGGKPVPWQISDTADLDKLEERWTVEMMEYVNEWREPTDPATVADATANAYVTAVAAIRRRQTTLLKDADWLETKLCEMALHSIKAIDETYPEDVRNDYPTEFRLHPSSSVQLASGQIEPGTTTGISAKDLKFDFDVTVTTRAVTESEQRSREELGMQRVEWGTGTMEEVVETGYPDATAQFKKLAIDKGRRIIQSQMVAQVDAAYRDRVKTRAGILIPPGMPVAPDQQAQQVGNSPMVPAATGQATGGEFG